MKRFLKTTAAGLALAFIANAASADSRQLAASAGLDPSKTAHFSLVEIAQAKFNAECRKDDQHSILGPHGVQVDPAAHAGLIAAAGLTADEAEGRSLAEIGAAKNNRDARADDFQIVVSGREMPDIRPDKHAQLIAAAGLTTDATRGMTLTQVAAAKMSRESARD